jgi:hypothetical protein
MGYNSNNDTERFKTKPFCEEVVASLKAPVTALFL